MARRILLKIAYDGTNFQGYQIQAAGRTVQGVLEEGIGRLHGHPIRTVPAGRTDSGVHARGQYVSFTSDLDGLGIDDFPRAVNTRIPHDVSALQAWHVRDDFHARYDAIRRHYRYYLLIAAVRDPHRRAYAYRIPQWPNLKRLNQEAAELVGTHDFTTFAHRRDERQRMTRTVYYAHFRGRGDQVEFAIGADGFLWRMVRSIVGTLVERERHRLRGDYPAESVSDLLASRDRSRAGTTAPAWGLFLHDVEFKD